MKALQSLRSLFSNREPSRAHRRYLSDRPTRVDGWLEAAQSYVSKKSNSDRLWLYRKPFDPSPGNREFFTQIYQVANLLEAMRVTPGGRILEVGSGPGWVTEILVLLGFEVDCIEPSAEMIAIARERIELISKARRLPNPRVHFHETTLEEVTLPDESMDAAFFHESLHHIIDEDRGMAQCFRVLRAGGVIGISEWAWTPGDVELERALDEEMRRYGTLENPYSPPYLDSLLRRHGFTSITRYHQINGYFSLSKGSQSIATLAQGPALHTNNLTALKPWADGPSSADFHALSMARIEVRDSRVLSGGEVRVRVRLTNTGETTWLARREEGVGTVRLAVRSEKLEDALEATDRRSLAADVPPGKSIEVDLEFQLSEHNLRRRWFIDLVNEGLYWFSVKGTEPAEIRLPTGA